LELHYPATLCACLCLRSVFNVRKLFLHYSLGLRNYPLPEAHRDLAEKSAHLLLKEWMEHGHIHENYNADTGEGCDSQASDAFYHWGGLLGMILLIEVGKMPAPEMPLR
jgi:hypothetical protein